jgi:hypothetical protein
MVLLRIGGPNLCIIRFRIMLCASADEGVPTEGGFLKAGNGHPLLRMCDRSSAYRQ